MSHSMHMCISVRGVLSRTDRDLVKEWGNGALSHKGKKLYTAMEIREAFFDELSEGHEVIPLGKCDNFDYKTGCRGHEIPDDGLGLLATMINAELTASKESHPV